MRPLRSGLSLLFLMFAADAGPASGKVLELEQPLEGAAHGTWIPVMGPSVPPSSESVATAYDAAHDRLLLLGDGWELWMFPLGPGGRWERLSVSGEPPDVVQSFSVVHDPGGSRLLVFGGITLGGLRSNTVWELGLAEGPRWSRLTPLGTPPPARSDHGAIYDPANRCMLIVGGRGEWYSWWNDVWALDLAGAPQWRTVTTSGPSPAMDSGARAAYDPQRQRMIVTFFRSVFMQAWALSLGERPEWSDLSPVGEGPIAIPFGWSLCVDSARERLLVISAQGNSGFHNGVWELALAGPPAWRIVESGGLPLIGGFSFSGAFDTARDRLILQNGHRSETWAVGVDHGWHQLAGGPRGRHGHGSVYDPLRERMVVMAGQSGNYFAGYAFYEYDGRIWTLALNDLEWTLTNQESPGLEAYGAAYDPIRDRIVGVGGMRLREPGCHPPYDPTVPEYSGFPWVIPLSDEASDPIPGSYFSVEGHSVTLDTRRNRVHVFGGVTVTWYCDHNAQLRSTYSNQHRLLSLGEPAGWSEVATPPDGPAPRAWHRAVYDEDRDRIWMWGGGGAGARFDELWEFDPARSTWTRLAVQGEVPPPSTGHSMIYDPVRERLVVFGGNPGSDPRLDGPWALSLAGEPRWERLVPAGEAPPGRSGHSAIYDPVNDQMVIFGGGDLRNDCWVLRWGDPLHRVAIDVRPGDPRNSVNLNSEGLLPIAILSSSTFDARSVDLSTVTVSGALPARNGDRRFISSVADVDEDGLLDLTFHVRSESLLFAEENPHVRLDGRSRDGGRIRGADQVRFVRRHQAQLLPESSPSRLPDLRYEGIHPAAGRVAGQVVATLPHSEPGVLEVFSVGGRRIHSRVLGAGTHRIDLRSLGPLAPGVYALRLRQSGHSTRLRVVVVG